MGKARLDSRIIFLVVAGLSALILYASPSGNFALTANSGDVFDDPQVFADSSDFFYVALYPTYTAIHGVPTVKNFELIAPDGRTIVVTYRAPFGSSPPIIAKISLDGTVLATRVWDSCEWISGGRPGLTVQGTLSGAAVDGTWIIKSGGSPLEIPSGTRLEIKGKILHDVNGHPALVDIAGCGSGSQSSDFLYVKPWNWHGQAEGATTSTSIGMGGAHQTPINWKFFVPFSTSVAMCSGNSGVNLQLGGTNYLLCPGQTNPPSTITYDFEDGLSPFETTTPAAWSVESSIYYDGISSARSAQISNGQETDLILQAYFPQPKDVSFARKVSSEKGYDFLRFYLNGIKLAEWSGEKEWDIVNFVIPGGANELRWVYEKDAARSAGEDAAWIDSVRISNTLP